MQLGIIGGGEAVGKALRGICRSKSWKIGKVWCNNGELEKILPSVPRAESIEELLNTSELDTIYIATPTGTHTELALEVLKRKKTVLIEKPLSVLPIDSATEHLGWNKTFVGVGFKKRFLPFLGKIQKLISRSQRPVKAKFVWYNRRPSFGSWRLDKKMSGGGVLMDLGSHVIDLFGLFFGRIICSSVKLIGDNSRSEIDWDAKAEIQFENNHTLEMELSWLKPSFKQEFQIMSDIEEFTWKRLDNGNDVISFGIGMEKKLCFPSDYEYTKMFDQLGLAVSGKMHKMPDINAGIHNLQDLEVLYRNAKWFYEKQL